MTMQQIDFSKVLSDDQVYDSMMTNYDQLGKDWIQHQFNWMNNVYISFKDHYKYMIVISLVEKTLLFYDQMNIQLTYDQYYSKSYLQIDKFSITELCEKLQLPKETIRRKVLELEKLGVLKRIKKQMIIDRNAFDFVKPENQIRFTSKYINQVAEILNNKKIFSKKVNQKFIEQVIKKNFSKTWRWFYKMQIPLVIGYHEMFKDLATFHIWGSICMNQAFNYKKENIVISNRDHFTFNTNVIKGTGNKNGLSAMSISDMTNIPRATVIRKCKFLIDNEFIMLNEKKQYILTSINHTKIIPHQKEFFKGKAKFLRKVLNLLTIS